MNDDLTLLASTYLDGEATPDERARVEADPSLLAEVERLRAARATLLDARWFERPGADVRETAIEAALAAWDVSPSGLAGSTLESRPAPRRSHVTSFERRRSYTRLLGAAAALVAVVGLGAVIAQLGGGDGGGDQSSVAIEPAADTQARSEAGAELTEQIAPDETASAVFSDDAAPSDAGGADSDVGTSAEQAASGDAATEATEAPAATTPAAAAPAPPTNITTLDELGRFAADAKAAAGDGVTRDDLSTSCAGQTFDDIDEYVAMVTYRGRPVMIGIDADDERAIAVDPDTCEIVARAPLP
ncbi:MAG TPA: hypothetical protein VFV63_05315 [Ilumatobacteraceae bacterium]|nr:hypothetical protein [Ilumatobacteraceae bacterium]